MERKSYKIYKHSGGDMYTDDNDEYFTSKKHKKRDQERKQQRQIRNALKSKNLNYLLDLEDDY